MHEALIAYDSPASLLSSISVNMFSSFAVPFGIWLPAALHVNAQRDSESRWLVRSLLDPLNVSLQKKVANSTKQLSMMLRYDSPGPAASGWAESDTRDQS